VPPRQCPRCHATLLEQDGALVFCSNCGAPQVIVSEELLLQAQKQRAAVDSGVSVAMPGAVHPDGIVWPAAIRYAGLAGALAAALTLVAFAVPPIILLAWFWAVGAPVVVLGVYHAKLRPARLRAGFGARLGLLCGLAIAFCMSIVNAGALVLARYVFHVTEIDSQLANLFSQMRTNPQLQGNPAQATMLNYLNIPEYRAGLLLIMSGFVLVLYLGLSALGGAFAAMLRSRSNAG
jgi:hypothetical protein